MSGSAGAPLGLTIWSYRLRWWMRRSAPGFPAWESPLEVLDQVADLGFSGLQTGVDGWSPELARNVRNRCEQRGMVLEGQVELPGDEAGMERFERSLRVGRDAGAGIFRAYGSLERRYERFRSREEWEDWQGATVEILRRIEPLLGRLRVRLAVENHKDWRADEQAAVMRSLDSPWIGVCFDFGNNLSLLEEPLETARTLAPWIMTTHVKDMGLRTEADGFLLSEVPLGTGCLDLAGLVRLCRDANPGIGFYLEMIARDPLRVPCRTEDYRRTFRNWPEDDFRRTLGLAREEDARERQLPRESGRTEQDALAWEEDMIARSLLWWRANVRGT
jgi:sugar phosphate isomerase/epimerase